ncbi:MAG: RNA polymerase sigma factor [Planctomycetota bacterium]
MALLKPDSANALGRVSRDSEGDEGGAAPKAEPVVSEPQETDSPVDREAEPSEEEIDPDLETVDRVLAGDAGAYSEIVARHEGPLRAAVLGVIADREVCDDVLQDVFLIAYRRMPTFRREAPFGAWIYRIAIREALRARTRWRTRWKRWISVEDFDSIQPASGSAEEEVDTKLQVDDQLLPQLEKLSPRERAAIVLHGVEEKSYDEIAEIIGCTSGTVGSLIHRGRAKLKELLRISDAGDER